jgi:hypothetical protein
VRYGYSQDIRKSKLREVCLEYQKRYRFELGACLREQGRMSEENYSL